MPLSLYIVYEVICILKCNIDYSDIQLLERKSETDGRRRTGIHRQSVGEREREGEIGRHTEECQRERDRDVQRQLDRGRDG